jgi:hypothetical protein
LRLRLPHVVLTAGFSIGCLGGVDTQQRGLRTKQSLRGLENQWSQNERRLSMQLM